MMLAFALAITIAPALYQTRLSAPTSPARSAAEQKRAKRRAYEIAFADFLKSENAVFSLTEQLPVVKDARKQSREIEKQLNQMIRFLRGDKANRGTGSNLENPVPPAQAIAEFTASIAAVKPDLMRLNEEQKTTLDLPLQRSVVEQLQKARTLVQRIH